MEAGPIRMLFERMKTGKVSKHELKSTYVNMLY